MNEQDVKWMRAAIMEAKKAAAIGEVPVGAVIVDGDRVLGVGHNRRESDGDPTAHAEILALRQAAKAVGGWRVEATLYVTQEPCAMCAGALVNARVKRLVFGCQNPKAGAAGTLFNIPADPRLNHRVEITGSILADECGRLLTQFFEKLRVGV